MFQSLGRDSVGWDPQGHSRYSAADGCFNPSVGILWGGTSPWTAGPGNGTRFQSLGRDSVGWDHPHDFACLVVGFQWFQSLGRDSVGWDLSMVAGQPILESMFQSLGRDSVGWDPWVLPC